MVDDRWKEGAHCRAGRKEEGGEEEEREAWEEDRIIRSSTGGCLSMKCMVVSPASLDLAMVW